MTGYIAYIRVSTTKQGEKGSSLQEQRYAIESFAKKLDLTITRWIEERETAAKLGRPAFNEMIRSLQKGEAQGLIIHKIDRGARNLKDWAGIGELIDRGVEVHFAHEAIDLNSRGGRLLADIQAVVAADFIRNLRDEVRKGFYGRLKQGYYPLPAPIGYQDQGRARAKTIDPVIGPLVRQAFELYSTGDYSLMRLSDELYRRGLRAPSGKALHVSTLAKTIANPFYIGLMRIERTNEVFEGLHEPLISKRLFERIQIMRRSRIQPRSVEHFFEFQGMIKCSSCHGTLYGERQKGRYIYYRCHGRGCTNRASVSEKFAHQIIEQRLETLRIAEEEMRDFRDFIMAAEAETAQSAAAMDNTLSMRIGQLDQRLARLTDALLDGSLDKETFRGRKEALLLEKQGCVEQLKCSQSKSSWTETACRCFELGHMAYQRYIIGNPSQKREIIKSTVSKLVGVGKNLQIRLHSPFEIISETRDVYYGGPQPVTSCKLAPSFATAVRKEIENGFLTVPPPLLETMSSATATSLKSLSS